MKGTVAGRDWAAHGSVQPAITLAAERDLMRQVRYVPGAIECGRNDKRLAGTSQIPFHDLDISR